MKIGLSKKECALLRKAITEATRVSETERAKFYANAPWLSANGCSLDESNYVGLTRKECDTLKNFMGRLS